MDDERTTLSDEDMNTMGTATRSESMPGDMDTSDADQDDTDSDADDSDSSDSDSDSVDPS
jgi:hypothetical protein